VPISSASEFEWRVEHSVFGGDLPALAPGDYAVGEPDRRGRMNRSKPISEPVPEDSMPSRGRGMRLWREVMEDFADGVMVVNRRREVLFANAALTALAGEPPAQRGEGRRRGCCDLFGCRVPGSSLRLACLTD
jgi:PAS domain-containing protein